MDFTQAAAMMFQRVKGSRGDDFSLTETTAKLLFEPSRPRDECLRANKEGPDRRPGERSRSRRSRCQMRQRTALPGYQFSRMHARDEPVKMHGSHA
jgi:hypothetical protein